MITSTDQMAPAPVLLRDDQDGIVTLTLNRAAQYNALSADMLTSLQTELDDIAQNRALRVVVIAANGKAFCAGHDLKEMRASEDRAAAKIAAKPAHAVKIGKDMFYKQLPMDLADAYSYASDRMACNMNSHDAREGIDAFIQKRKPKWKDK